MLRVVDCLIVPQGMQQLDDLGEFDLGLSETSAASPLR